MDQTSKEVIPTVLNKMFPSLANAHITRLIKENMRAQMWLYIVSIVAMIVVAATSESARSRCRGITYT